jgi:hypothetical protein
MNFAFKNLVVIVLAIGAAASCYAQDCSSIIQVNLPKECYPVDGNVGSYYNKTSNTRGSGLTLNLLGKPSNISPAPNATIRVSKDVLRMSVWYHAPGSIIPLTIGLNLTSFSPTPSKYKDNHRLTIYLDDKLLLSENLEVMISGGIYERLLLQMKYTDFLKFTEAKKVTVQLGKTKIKLKPKDIEALNELNKTTKDLKPPTMHM